MGYLKWLIDVSSAWAFCEINIYTLVDDAVNCLVFLCRNNWNKSGIYKEIAQWHLGHARPR